MENKSKEQDVSAESILFKHLTLEKWDKEEEIKATKGYKEIIAAMHEHTKEATKELEQRIEQLEEQFHKVHGEARLVPTLQQQVDKYRSALEYAAQRFENAAWDENVGIYTNYANEIEELLNKKP